MANQTTTQIHPPPRQKLTIANVTRGVVQNEPISVLLYGTEGVGKTQWASNAPSPIFLSVERNGSNHLDVARLVPETFEDVMSAIHSLTVEEHDYKTLVVDTVDWLEPMIWQKVCREDGEASIEKVGGGYGKGFNMAIETWRQFLASLERLRDKRGMHIVLLAHARVRAFNNPEGANYDTWTLTMNDKAAEVLKAWPKAVLFATYETFLHKTSKKADAKAKAHGGTERIVHTQRTAGYAAKNRYGLPPLMPLNWGDFYAAVYPSNAEQAERAAVLRGEIIATFEAIGDDELLAKASGWILTAGDNLPKLAEALSRANTKLREKQEKAQ